MGPLNLELSEVPIETVAEFRRIPIAFLVERIHDVTAAGTPGRFTLSERAIDVPTLPDEIQLLWSKPLT